MAVIETKWSVRREVIRRAGGGMEQNPATLDRGLSGSWRQQYWHFHRLHWGWHFPQVWFESHFDVEKFLLCTSFLPKYVCLWTRVYVWMHWQSRTDFSRCLLYALWFLPHWQQDLLMFQATWEKQMQMANGEKKRKENGACAPSM